MEIVSWILTAVPVTLVAAALWAARRQARMMPPPSHAAERKPMRWTGWIHGGGHG